MQFRALNFSLPQWQIPDYPPRVITGIEKRPQHISFSAFHFICQLILNVLPASIDDMNDALFADYERMPRIHGIERN